MAWRIFSVVVGICSGGAVAAGAFQGRVGLVGFVVGAVGSVTIGVVVASYIGSLHRAPARERVDSVSSHP